MKRWRAVSIGRGQVVGSIAVLMVGTAGCRNTWGAFSRDSQAASDACTLPDSASGNRAQLVRWASGLVYVHDPRRARLHGFTHPTNGMAQVEVTSPARSRDRVRRGCIIGRIVSNYADTAFGFIAGTTYIWADARSPDAATLIADDGTTTLTGYEMEMVPLVDGKEPVASAGTPTKHICGECTKNDWCVYPSSTVDLGTVQAPTTSG